MLCRATFIRKERGRPQTALLASEDQRARAAAFNGGITGHPEPPTTLLPLSSRKTVSCVVELSQCVWPDWGIDEARGDFIQTAYCRCVKFNLVGRGRNVEAMAKKSEGTQCPSFYLLHLLYTVTIEEVGKATAEALLSALPYNGTRRLWDYYRSMLSLFRVYHAMQLSYELELSCKYLEQRSAYFW